MPPRSIVLIRCLRGGSFEDLIADKERILPGQRIGDEILVPTPDELILLRIEALEPLVSRQRRILREKRRKDEIPRPELIRLGRNFRPGIFVF